MFRSNVSKGFAVFGVAIVAIVVVRVVNADQEPLTPGDKFTAGIDRMQEGLDYFVDESGGLFLSDMWCSGSVNCNTKTEQCRFVAAGSVCYYCDGSQTDTYCIPYPDQTCTKAPGTALFTCGNEFQSTCNLGTCGPAGTPTNRLCRPTKCL